MSFIPFIKKRKEPQALNNYYIALDIGTEVLKGLLFSATKLGVEVWVSYHVKQQVHAMRSGVILNEETVIENSKLVIQKLIENLQPEEYPDTMVLGMAGELINGISITVDYDRGNLKDKPINKKEKEFIINSVYGNILENGKGELAKRLNVTEDQVVVLHISLTGVDIDQRQVLDMLGETGQNVRLYLYASFAPKKYVETLKNIAQKLNLNIGAVVTQPFAVSRAFSGGRDPSFSSIFIDIGGGTTDVALVQNGNSIQTQMYAFGGRAFTNRISEDMNVPYNIAEERKIKYSLGELPLDVRDEVRRIIVPDVKLWIDTLEIALKKMEGVKELPAVFYMCGGGAMLPDIREQILAYPWHKVLPFKRLPKAILVTPDRLDKVYDKSGQLVNPFDVTPASLARFYWDTLKYPEYNYLGDY